MTARPRSWASVVTLVVLCLACSGKSEKSPSAGKRDAAVPRDAAWPAHVTRDSMADAIGEILSTTKGSVIGFGEFHPTTTSKPVMPAMQRFSADIGKVAAGASDLIIETWVEAGNCGAKEQTVSRDVQQTTERPAAVENHLMTMINAVRKMGVQPNVMVMQCADYDYVLDDKGAVDYEKMLLLIKRKLADLAALVWNKRTAHSADAGPYAGRVLLYGGALHNNIHPTAGLEEFSYAPEVQALVGDAYVEIDLLVPEYIEGNPLVVEQSWYPSFMRHASTDKVLVFQRGPRSYIVILRRGRTS